MAKDSQRKEWIRKTRYEARLKQQQKSKVLLHYQKLQVSFDRVLVDIRSGASSDEDAADKIFEMQTHLQGMGDYLKHHLDPKYYNKIRQEDSTIASQVFNIPELADLILWFSDAVDILAMQQVNKFLCKLIDQSSVLQIALYLKPGIKSYNSRDEIRHPFEGTVNPTFEIMHHNRFFASFRRIETEIGLPEFGVRWMKMFISQPPIKSLTLWTELAGCSRHNRTHSATIMCETRFTLGDIYEEAKMLFAAPVLCRSCEFSRQHRPNLPPSPLTRVREVMFDV